MPARHTVFFILAFWAATTGWLYYRDIRPYVTPGNPPPFTISLADEAEAFRFHTNDESKRKEGLEWSIYQDDDIKGYAVTWVKYYKNDDSFELHGQYKFWSKGRFSASDPDQLIKSSYRVTREGELRAVNAKIEVKVPLVQAVYGQLTGTVENGRMTPHIVIEAPPPFGPVKRDLQPIEIKSRGSVLNPLQPLNRLPGLRRGQHWRMPMVDPLDDVIRGLTTKVPGLGDVQTPKTPYLEAEVLRDTISLSRNDGAQQVECLVVEYHGDDMSARTLVGVDDSLVYQQEVTHQGQTLKMVREDAGSKLQDKLNKLFSQPKKK
jgi:hypothetical protein